MELLWHFLLPQALIGPARAQWNRLQPSVWSDKSSPLFDSFIVGKKQVPLLRGPTLQNFSALGGHRQKCGSFLPREDLWAVQWCDHIAVCVAKDRLSCWRLSRELLCDCISTYSGLNKCWPLEQYDSYCTDSVSNATRKLSGIQDAPKNHAASKASRAHSMMH